MTLRGGNSFVYTMRMQQRRSHFSGMVTRAADMDYWVYLPRGYEQSNECWPLVLFLHGAGERGNIEKAVKHGPPKRIAEGVEFPFVLVVPSCQVSEWWEATTLAALLDEVCTTYRIDENRVYGTGLSMGGFGIWSMAIAYPKRFAAIAPVCGGGMPYLVHRILRLPVWAFHGAKDTIVPLYESQRMIEALRLQGSDAKITVYPDLAHDAWTQTYENAELYEWMLSQRRQER